MQPAFRPLRGLRGFALGIVFVVGASAASCGSDSKTQSGGAGTSGTGGTGGTSSQKVETITCGANSCDGQTVISGIDPLKPCCAANDACGLDSTFLSQYGPMFSEACQMRDQPGVLDTSCPDSLQLTLPNGGGKLEALKGCCRNETHTCGYLLDSILNGFVPIGLGCIESTPFLDGGTADSCGSGGGGAAGGGG
jgi:hypothetical protein